MKTVAIISRKGGAGKTTLAIHLATAAESAGISTAIFDLDPQASSAVWADKRKGDDPEAEPKPPVVIPAQAPRLPALLAQARRQDAGLVILDTAPHDDIIATDAAERADLIIIPCRPSALDLAAIGTSVKLARASGLPFYVIINAAPSVGTEANEAVVALTGAKVPVCPVVLHHRKAFGSYIEQGSSAGEAEPKGKAAEEVNKLFKWLSKEVGLLYSEQVTNVIRR
jgi:chromosome partitioning protein